MARDLTAAYQSAITADVVVPALLLSMEFTEGTVNAWTGFGDLTWDSKTFSGVGDFGSLSDVDETSNIQANGVTFTLSGIPSSLISVALTYEYQGRPVRCWLAALNITTGAIIADPYQIFAGRMDVMTINEGAESATITLTAESVLIDLQRPRNRRYTHEDQIAEFSGDLFFEYVAGLVEKNITWGTNAATSNVGGSSTNMTPQGRNML